MNVTDKLADFKLAEDYFKFLNVYYELNSLKKAQRNILLNFKKYKNEIDFYSSGLNEFELIELYRFALAKAYADSMECLQQHNINFSIAC